MSTIHLSSSSSSFVRATTRRRTRLVSMAVGRIRRPSSASLVRECQESHHRARWNSSSSSSSHTSRPTKDQMAAPPNTTTTTIVPLEHEPVSSSSPLAATTTTDTMTMNRLLDIPVGHMT
eukprot:scaffold599393_cov67-Attheya_sp.AAC.1